MTLAEARRHIWERLATTAREDGRCVDWEEEGFDEFEARRLRKASEQVARTIDLRLGKGERR
jgi:hypothetical protein